MYAIDQSTTTGLHAQVLSLEQNLALERLRSDLLEERHAFERAEAKHRREARRTRRLLRRLAAAVNARQPVLATNNISGCDNDDFTWAKILGVLLVVAAIVMASVAVWSATQKSTTQQTQLNRPNLSHDDFIAAFASPPAAGRDVGPYP